MALISTRLHGVIDYAVSSAFLALAGSSRVPRTVRSALGSAAAFHTSYSVLTDYEAGVRPAVGMRTHLTLDTLGGIALCVAGIRLRRESPGARGLLIAAGLSELAVVALSATRRSADHEHTDTVAYPPLDVPKPVADGVWIVDSELPGLVGKAVGVRMTVLRLENGDLLLHSPTRVTAGLRASLERLGRIRHLVAPNLAHLSFIADWQALYSDSILWAAPGVARRGKARSGEIRIDRELHVAPSDWGGAVELVLVPGGAGFTEAALFHRPTGTLVLTDLVLNLERAKVPALLRPLMRLFGTLAPDGMPPPYLRAILRARPQALAATAQRLVDLAPERVIFSHGRWFERDATAALRRSLRWALR